MRDQIIAATEQSLNLVTHPRLFRTERGYAAMCYYFLMDALIERGLLTLPGDRLLEMEYQKGSRHELHWRPDLIFHTPVEVSGVSERENNYATWSFKLGGGVDAAKDDFEKLDDMFRRLDYALGFFVNIDGEEDFLESYAGPFRDRLVGATVRLRNNELIVHMRPCPPLRR